MSATPTTCMPCVRRAWLKNIVPNLPAPISPTVTGRPAAFRSSKSVCRFTARNLSIFPEDGRSQRDQKAYWQIARETKDSSLHSCGLGARPSRYIWGGHLNDDVMSTLLPRAKPFALHSASDAPSQSGAPFGASAQSSCPATTLVAGSRATVPAASVTPLARSPAALGVAPVVSPAPFTPAPTLEIDWSMNLPMAPIASCGVGSSRVPCGGAGASAGAAVTAGGSD